MHRNAFDNAMSCPSGWMEFILIFYDKNKNNKILADESTLGAIFNLLSVNIFRSEPRPRRKRGNRKTRNTHIHSLDVINTRTRFVPRVGIIGVEELVGY